ncbi:MAG: arginine repressor [Clostridia bacterium]|nr:arginine repressor [Clostridia bacterium]MDE7328687.1 arginine repressor [Clostridia bacterium]
MAYKERQKALLEIINTYELDTQEDLVYILREHGFSATQATVSRDIKQLGLVKIAGSSKKYRYTQVHDKQRNGSNKYGSIYKEIVLSVQSSGNMIVIKTVSGAANSAAAYLDNLALPTILGTIAGDDTVFCVATSEQDALEIIKSLKENL